MIAPKIGGVKSSDGKLIPADEMIDGGPSVLFDAVALMISSDGAKQLADDPTARDFVADEVAHHKFIAHSEAAQPLPNRCSIAPA